MCTLQKQGNLYILTLTGNNEHRLNPTLITSIQSTLSQIKSQVLQSKTPSALITTSQGKFFSNGYDLTFSNSSPSNAKLMVYQFQSLISEFLSLPMPTISAITGHASAAGFILAMAHDYVVMRRERGFLYMSELDIGLKLPRWFVAMVNCKIGQPLMRKRVVLRAEKVTGEMGKEMGLVDEVFDGEEGTIDGAIKLGENLIRRGWDGEIYGVTRKKMFKEVLMNWGLMKVSRKMRMRKRIVVRRIRRERLDLGFDKRWPMNKLFLNRLVLARFGFGSLINEPSSSFDFKLV